MLSFSDFIIEYSSVSLTNDPTYSLDNEQNRKQHYRDSSGEIVGNVSPTISVHRQETYYPKIGLDTTEYNTLDHSKREAISQVAIHHLRDRDEVHVKKQVGNKELPKDHMENVIRTHMNSTDAPLSTPTSMTASANHMTRRLVKSGLNSGLYVYRHNLQSAERHLVTPENHEEHLNDALKNPDDIFIVSKTPIKDTKTFGRV